MPISTAGSISISGITTKFNSVFTSFSSGSITVGGPLVPNTTLSHDLGSSDLRWRDLYLAGNTIDLGGLKLSNEGTTLAVRNTAGALSSIETSEVKIVGADNRVFRLQVTDGNVKLTDSSNGSVSLGDGGDSSFTNINATNITSSSLLVTNINSTNVTSSTLMSSEVNIVGAGNNVFKIHVTGGNVKLSDTNNGSVTLGTYLQFAGVKGSGTCMSNHSMAISKTGEVYAWGANGSGQLGRNNTTQSTVPVNISTFGSLSGRTVVAVAGGSFHTIALDSTGAVHTWGLNTNGQLGRNNTTQSNVPVNVSTFGSLSGRTVIAIACGGSRSMAFDNTGEIHTWGINSSGQLGRNNTTNSSVPVNVSAFGSLFESYMYGGYIRAIACGRFHTITLNTYGEVHTWGSNSNGQLGNNTTTNSSVPINVSSFGSLSGRTVVAIAGGEGHTIALDSTGAVHTWGRGTSGQLGRNSTSNSRVPVLSNLVLDLSPQITNIPTLFTNFTGQHRCFVDGHKPSELPSLVGLILVSDKNTYVTMNERGQDAITINESLPLLSLSKVPYDKRAFGVLSLTYNDNEPAAETKLKMQKKGDVRIQTNSVGEGAIWVCDANGPLEAGDNITTSAVPGYGMRQEQDQFFSYTVAKITMDCDFTAPLIEVMEMKKDEFGQAILDEHGMPIWEVVMEPQSPLGDAVSPSEGTAEGDAEPSSDVEGTAEGTEGNEGDAVPKLEEAYKMRYLLPDGTIIDKATYESRIAESLPAFRAAFVGCTYHCG
jgi:alpha-tubulin suppressor-like RCC1 family protein